MKVEKVYQQPEIDKLEAEVQHLHDEKYELMEEIAEIRYHLSAIKKFIENDY